jgi:hypothetical protein
MKCCGSSVPELFSYDAREIPYWVIGLQYDTVFGRIFHKIKYGDDKAEYI